MVQRRDIARQVRASIAWALDVNETNAEQANELQGDGLHFLLQVSFPSDAREEPKCARGYTHIEECLE